LLAKLPGVQKKVRVAIDWILDLFFSKDIVQLPKVRSLNVSEAEETPITADITYPRTATRKTS
jgi:post-segregation antitoxin (ccd killing protein)